MSTPPDLAAGHAAPQLVELAIAELKRDPELVCRVRGINKVTVREYAQQMLAHAPFPPVTVFRDANGTLWLADGFHRTAAAELAKLEHISAEVHPGARNDALLFAARGNSQHGLRRSNADKRRAVELVLASFPDWSDRKISEACGVDHKTVGRIRTGEIPQAAGRLGDNTAPGRLSERAALAAWLASAGAKLAQHRSAFRERPELHGAFDEAEAALTRVLRLLDGREVRGG